MKIQAGNAVRGENFFKRENIIRKARNLIESGHHILFAAPRRVGKTSIMYYLEDNPKDNYNFIYMITESVNNENEFYRRILNRLLKTDIVKSSKKILTFLERHFPKIKKVGPEGIEFGVKADFNYYEMLIKILTSISADETKVVIMIDEFPQTLENIIEDEGERAGKLFLHRNRELRHDTEISKNIQFIYTGSIGLENIVSKLNATKTINDLSRLSISPLTTEEAKKMINLLLKKLPFNLTSDLIGYILNQIQWLIPFYIQLVLQEIKNIHRDEGLTEISKAIVDKAINGMLDQRHHFDHWHTRLRTTLNSKEYNFTKEVLNISSESGTIESREIYNLAVKYKLENTYKDIIGTLIYDGYINNIENAKIYHYNSPILSMWWRQNVAN